jgi:hypothetical protein
MEELFDAPFLRDAHRIERKQAISSPQNVLHLRLTTTYVCRKLSRSRMRALKFNFQFLLAGWKQSLAKNRDATAAKRKCRLFRSKVIVTEY